MLKNKMENNKAETWQKECRVWEVMSYIRWLRKAFSSDVTCKQKVKGSAGADSCAPWGKDTPGSGNPECKELRQGSAGDIKEQPKDQCAEEQENDRRRSCRGDGGVGCSPALWPLGRMQAFISNGL